MGVEATSWLPWPCSLGMPNWCVQFHDGLLGILKMKSLCFSSRPCWDGNFRHA